jgi:flavin-dependent dehydrogenase
LRQRAASQHSGRVLLIGDAAGYVDALTGEGMGIALGGAELIVNAVLANDPAGYTRHWRRMSRRYRMLTWRLLTTSNFGRPRPDRAGRGHSAESFQPGGATSSSVEAEFFQLSFTFW